MHKIFGEKENGSYFDRVGAYLIPIKDGKVAVAKMKSGCFLLGGKIEEGETDEGCIKRECLEEVGYDVAVNKKLCTAETYCHSEKVGLFHPIRTYYSGEILEKVQMPTENDHEFIWLPLKDAESEMAVEMQAWAVHMAAEMMNEASK